MVAPTAYGKNRFKQTHHNGSFGISTILGRGRRPRQPENKRFNTPHTTTDYLDFCHTCRGRRPRRPANKHFNQTTPQRLISISTIRRRGDHWSSATNDLTNLTLCRVILSGAKRSRTFLHEFRVKKREMKSSGIFERLRRACS